MDYFKWCQRTQLGGLCTDCTSVPLSVIGIYQHKSILLAR